MRDVNVYLSSTDLIMKPDCFWKSNFQKDINRLVSSSNEYRFHLYDPLQNISDKPEIVSDDIQHIIFSDFVVCYLQKSDLTIGTLMELQYSCINKPKDCVILIDKHHQHYNHPWIKYWVKHVVFSEHEAASRIVNILGNSNFTNLKEV